MNFENYVSPSKIKKQFDITSGTLRNWAEQGKIDFLRPNNGKRIYNVKDVERIFGLEPKQSNKITICYARVSSTHQKQDLERQVEILKTQYPNATIIKDIASGLNWDRPGFNSILEQVFNGNVETVVVTYKDRMCRFGLQLVEWIFKKFDVKLMVLNTNNEFQNPSAELSEDLLSIVTVFVAKNNGLRAGKYRRERKETKEKEEAKEKEERSRESNQN